MAFRSSFFNIYLYVILLYRVYCYPNLVKRDSFEISSPIENGTYPTGSLNVSMRLVHNGMSFISSPVHIQIMHRHTKESISETIYETGSSKPYHIETSLSDITIPGEYELSVYSNVSYYDTNSSGTTLHTMSNQLVGSVTFFMKVINVTQNDSSTQVSSTYTSSQRMNAPLHSTLCKEIFLGCVLSVLSLIMS